MKSREKKQSIIPYGLGTASAAMSYLLTTQLTYCLTDSYGMSAVIVGTIMLASRIFDGVTDIAAGFIIDKTHTKYGKARPYDLFCIPLWIMLLFCFNVPGFGTVGKVIWIFLTYNLCQSVCYTFVTVSATVRIRRSYEENKRAKALSIGAMMSALASSVTSIICPMLIAMFESRPHGWVVIISCFAVPGIIMTLLMFFLLPELEEEEEETEKKEKITVAESVKALFANHYIWFVTVAVVMISAANVVISTSGNWYFKYVYGDLTALSLVGMLGVVGFLFLAVMPMMTRKFGNRNTMLAGFVLIAVANGLKYVMPMNLLWIAVCATVSAFGIALTTSMRDLLLIDCMKYGEMKTHKKYEGVYSATKGFADKIALGIGSVIAGAVVEMGGYDPTLEVQSMSAKGAITFAYAGLPAIIGVIGVISMAAYHLEKKLKDMQ